MSLLQIKNLNVEFKMSDHKVMAVRNLSLEIEKGQTLGLVGESGCGKTVTAYSILRLLKSPGKIKSGQIIYNGTDLLALPEKELRKIRGKEIAMIFQEPMTSLNPVFTIGFQLIETIKLHLKMNKHDAQKHAIKLLNEVGIPNPDLRINSYPHELSGGMRQRVMIAMALSAGPSILIADEPTTALDVTIQAQILDLLIKLQKERGMTLLMISHNLGIVANIADKIAIMYAGEVLEYGDVKTIFDKPLHPYTIGLFEAIPKIGSKEKRLKTIPGTVPTIKKPPLECIFYARCNKKLDICLNKIPLDEQGEGHLVRCVNLS